MNDFIIEFNNIYIFFTHYVEHFYNMSKKNVY